MRKLKYWLFNELLPVWAKQELLAENRRLRDKVIGLQARIREQDSYIEGLEAGIRLQRKIIINTGEMGE